MLVRVCDNCMEIIEHKDYINIEYIKHLDGGLLGSRISLTLCERCFQNIFGKGHLENMINQYEKDRLINVEKAE